MRWLLSLALVAGLAQAANAPQRYTTPIHDAAGVPKACEAALANARRHVGLMEKKASGNGFFNEWNQLQIVIEDGLNPIYLLGEVSPDKPVRDAAEPCLQKFATLSTELFQNEKLFKRLQAAGTANPRQAKLKRDLLEGFEDNGVTLPAEKRARVKAIFDKLEELRQAYDRNIRDDPTRVTFTPAEMAGLPESYLKAHEKARDKDGNYVLTLAYPSYFPFLANATDGEARRRYYVAKFNEGGDRNLAILEEIFTLRRELAGIYGLPTFAHYALRRRMVGTPEVVNKFLADVKDAVTELEKKELEELRAAKAQELGKPLADTRLERWDSSYYLERVRRERFSVDQEGQRKYLPTGKSIDFTLLLSQRLYGVTFKEAKVPTWHPDVRYFDVFDAKSGAFLSGFYLDLFPREGKYNHAAAFPLRGASRVAKRLPLAALVANLDRTGLTQEELEVLLHEFGHVLHGVLATTDYVPHSGNGRQDFIEAPSKMYEEWARREQSLALFKEICADCPQLGTEQIARLEAARRYGQGVRYGRQWLYSVFDMELSTDPKPPLAVWQKLESATPLGFVEGTKFPAAFSHIASSYAAGYYGYMWAEVLALDMLSAYKGNLLDPQVGSRYREIILAQGNQQDEMELVRKFLGREPSSDAFFKEITGKR
ncbi:MAG TPA: M3 family metallopeptidase [Usitatibacter sp.]|nr:M3 family metallopeptidase [Usitatibacter sp.]